MRTLSYDKIVREVAKVCIEANKDLSTESENYYREALAKETDPRACEILKKYIENLELARANSLPLCQDTGTAVFFIEKGVDLKIEGKSALLANAINDGVALGYGEGLLRKSIVCDPLFERKNTGTNVPAIIHMHECEGESLVIEYAPKGGGAENMSRLKMLPPSAGIDGVVDFVVETVLEAGANPCPPVVIGVGIGGNFEEAPLLAKKALFKTAANINSNYAELEAKILAAVNNTGIGPQGFGGLHTAFAVRIEHAPCHIASMPVAVNLNCHVHRHAKIVF